MMKTTIHSHKHIQLQTGPDYRLVIISDIHGHAALLSDLLEKIALKEEDYLVVLGDFVNRGPENLPVVALLMELANRPRTFIMKGNHESFVTTYVQSQENFKDMLAFLKEDPYVLILHEMAKKLDIDLYSCEDPEYLRQALLENFAAELSFMDLRPLIFENETFLCVHAGYEPSFSLEADEGKLLKYDFYDAQSPVQEKTVIVGHWPSSNLRSDHMTNLPFFNTEKNIITIDGGLGVKDSGELNALIITSVKGDIRYETLQANSFKTQTISQPMTLPVEDCIFVNYPHFDIELIEKGPTFTLCKHVNSGKTLSVFNSLVYEEEGKNRIKTSYINRFFNLPEGEEVEVCQVFEDCVLVKHQNEFGWVLPEQLG